VETVYENEALPAPRRIDRTTGQPVAGVTMGGSSASAELFNVGAFLSVNYKLFDPWLKLTGGLRYDHNSHYGGQASGRFGATSRLSRTVVAKLLYGNAFKAPSAYLLYAVPLRPGDVVGNSALSPQHIHTLEYQLSWKPSAFFDASSGVAYSWLLQKAEFTPQGINQTARNVASQRSLSWESRISVHRYHDYTAYLSGELLHSVRDLGQEGYAADLVGTANVVYPNWIGRGGFIVGVPKLPIEFGAEGLLVGPRRAAETNIVENGKPYNLPSYLLVDLSLATRELYLVRGHESRIAMRARNVLGNATPDPGFSGFDYPRAPREVFLEFQHVY
jgi:iron complex outermembrane receptor protein